MHKRTPPLGAIVAGSLIAGVVVAAGLVAGPFAGADEPVVTGAALLGLASGWALLAGLSVRWTDQPQRWAYVLAGYLGVAGGGLLMFAPGDSVLDALGWIWPAVFLSAIVHATLGARRHLPGRTRRGLVYPVLVVYALIALGGGYQTTWEFMNQRVPAGAGSVINVAGRWVHLACHGSGGPTVVLEAGLGETSASWGWIAPAVAQDTRVCLYDRAGRGGSEPASFPQDGVGVATDLHRLLAAARVDGPVVLVGHSSGAQYVRIFAGRYPEQVAGMVLLDAQPAEAFERLPAYPAFYRGFRRVSALLPSLARVGVGRMVFHAAFVNLPMDARDRQRANYSSARFYRSLHDELVELPAALAQASAVQSIGDRPLMVVTAARDAQAGWLPLQDELVALSSNSLHRVLPGATHASLVEDKRYAAVSSQAIREVVASVRSGAKLR